MNIHVNDITMYRIFNGFSKCSNVPVRVLHRAVFELRVLCRRVNGVMLLAFNCPIAIEWHRPPKNCPKMGLNRHWAETVAPLRETVAPLRETEKSQTVLA